MYLNEFGVRIELLSLSDCIHFVRLVISVDHMKWYTVGLNEIMDVISIYIDTRDTQSLTKAQFF